MAFIAIDLGTSFIKAAILDLDANEVQQVHRVPFPEPLEGLDPLKCEFDPRSVVDAVSRLLSQLSASRFPFEGLAMCTQMSSLVLMDPDGKARSNCIGWRDQRALQPHPSGEGSYFDVLKSRLTPEQTHELGNEMPPGTPASFLFWMSERNELEPGLAPVSLGDYVLSTLCGSPPSVDVTNAMAYELLRLKTLEWHEPVIRELGLKKLRWPKIRQHGDVVGTLQISGQAVPCYTPVGDYQCALAGALLQKDELSLNISTGSQVSRLTDDLQLGDYQTRPYFDGKFTNTFSHLPAGRSLNVLVDLIAELSRASAAESIDPWEYIAKAVADVHETDLQVDLSFFPGPCGDKGSISAIREKNLTIGTLFRAAFENMAQNYFDLSLKIWPDRSWKQLVFSGGLARKVNLLRDLIEYRCNTKSRLCPLEEDTLLGLLVLARVFSHRDGSVAQANESVGRHFGMKSDVQQSLRGV